MQKRLLTIQEAKIFSGLGERYPGCDIISMFQIEQVVMREKLGQTLYETLLGNLADCKEVPKIVNGKLIEPKFKKGACGDLYNTLWCDYLAKFLALQVQVSTMGLNISDTTGLGEVVKVGDDFAPATDKVIGRKYDALATLIHNIYTNMDIWIKSNNTTECFDGYIGFGDCCTTCYRSCDCTCSKEVSEELSDKGWYYMA